jgi:outer membrane protein assembly factor BamB
MSDDKEVLDLIEQGALEELTPEQCAAIRAAAAASPAIRQACLERIGLEERLAATLGRPRVSIDDLLAGRRRIAESRIAGRWLAPLLLALLVAGVAAAIALRPRAPREAEVAMAPRAAAVDADAADGAEAPPGEARETTPADAEAAEPDAKPTDPAQQDAAEANAAAATARQAPPQPVAAPWAAALAPDAPEPALDVLFRPLPLRQMIDRTALETWFAPLPDGPPKFEATQVAKGTQLTTMTGRFRLVPPLREGTALRLLVSDPGALRIVAWSGNSGATIEAEGPTQAWRWCGSVLSRSAADKPVDSRWLASTSDARGHRSGAGWSDFVPFTGILELRFSEGMFVLSRGEVRLVEVPLPAAPDEVLFEGAMTIGGLELVRSVPPPPLPEPPPATSAWRPAELAWEGTGATTLEKRPDGGVRLAQTEAAPKTPLITTWKLPPPEFGPRELVVRLDDFTPGTGVFLDGPDGKQIICGFVAPTAGGPPDRQGNLFSAWSSDKSPLTAGDPKNLGFAFAPRPVWLRFQVGDSLLTVSWSGDGRRWARLRHYPQVWTAAKDAAISSVGLFAGAHPGRSITLAEIAVAELPAIARILPRDLLPAVNGALVPETDAKRFGDWVAATLKQKPEGTEETRWLAAAAIRCLATGRTNLTQGLCSLVWQYARSLDVPLAEQLHLCDDIQRLIPGPMNQHNFMIGCIHTFVARDHVDKGDIAGFRQAWLRMQQAAGDFSYLISFGEQVDPLGVRSFLTHRLFVTGPADALRTELDRQQLYDNDVSPLAAAIAGRSEQGSPLVIETPNERYNAAVALDAAIAAGEWADAQRAMARFTAAVEQEADLHGLVPDPRDGERLVSLPLMMADALAGDAGFRDFMLREQAERGRLRVLQLGADGDAAGLVKAAVEFQGTPAAAEAHEWLALRSLSAGGFTDARCRAEAGLPWATADARDRLVTIRTMAESLTGGPVMAVPKTTGMDAVPAAEVAAVVAAAGDSAGPQAVTPFAPAALEAVKRIDLGPAGLQPGNPLFPGSWGGPIEHRFHRFFETPPLFRGRVDWAAEECSFTATPDRLLVNNRVELVAVDPATGAEQWRTPAGRKPGGLASYGLLPMRATCDRQHAYVRRLADGPSPILAAVRLADGTTAWETAAEKGAAFVSDPVMLFGTLWVCEVTPGQFDDELALVAIDPETGSRRRRRVIGRLTRGWQVTPPGQGDSLRLHGDCQIAVAEDRLYVVAGGTVLACDAAGRPVWLRRQPWVGPDADGWWWRQAQTPPLVHADTLFVVQPGVQAVTALEARNGRLTWRVPLSGVRQLFGLAGEGDGARLVVETAEGIISVEPKSGVIRNLLDARDGPGDVWLGIGPTRLMGTALATADGHAIVAVQRRRPEPGKPDVLEVAILWIDVVSGTVVHTAELPALAGNPPWAGPLASAGGSLWLLAHPNPADLRRSLWQLAPQKAR